MKLSSLTLMVTDDCNFDCCYCYKTKKKNIMEFATAKRALLFFYLI